MPRAPKKCARCDTRVIGKTFCDSCKPAWKTSRRPGSTRQSRKVRAEVLDRDPICTCSGCPKCTVDGCQRPSTEDDHRTNLAAGGSEALDNHAGKCTPCHGWKTQQEAARGRGGTPRPRP